MSDFERETSIVGAGDGGWTARLARDWNIGETSNGGYALTPVLRALCELTGQPDPISVTTHFLRPATGGTDSRIETTRIRAGRTISTAQGSLSQAGKERLVVIAALGDLRQPIGSGPELSSEPPELPPVERCVRRNAQDQGVDLPILSRVDVLIHPDHAVPGGSKQAVLEGWIRFADNTEPSSLSLPLFADAFPPALFALLGNVGRVPTVELTVHVRRRPAAGWLRGRFECDDLHQGRMIETGALWDSRGALVARCRQVGLLIQR